MPRAKVNTSSWTRLHRWIDKVDRLLSAAFGEPSLSFRDDPTGSLVRGILSANTNDVNRDRAFKQLTEVINNWDDVEQMPIERLAKLIRPAGMSETRTRRIIGLLRYIRNEFGSLDASPLLAIPASEAFSRLVKIDGIGEKTAAVFLVFNHPNITNDYPFFPVDTHIARVSARIGWVEVGSAPPRVQRLLSSVVQPKRAQPFHLNLIELGRRFCSARKTNCDECPVKKECEKHI